MANKYLTKNELQKLIDENHESVKLVKKKKNSNSSQMWEHFHTVVVNDLQQQFVSCDTCKTLLVFTSTNGTNTQPHLKIQHQ